MSDLTRLLHSTFGFPAFRVNQEAVCRAATDGRDVLLVMPTGAGKSLCYQLPAIARGGTALVISPLIALMDDQAGKLSAAGLRVARIHSGLSREDSRQACRDYLDGKLQFLFIAPERMRVPGFPEMLARRKPALIAIDEAHCISAWGHDFRPDYRLLGDYLPALRPSPIIALTATATPAVQKDIVTQLHLERPTLFIHGFRRENLAIEAVELSKPKRTEFTERFLADKARRPAIVYAPSRQSADELAATLGRKYPAAAYHAGLPPDVRERIQERFQTGKLEVVVATIAFGMGIDKADVRSVVHLALPGSVEAFYQEIGRAGRDGLPARTVLLYGYADRKTHEFFLQRDYPEATELVKVANALTDEFLMPDGIAGRLRMDRDVVAKALDKLASQGAAQFDIAGNVRKATTTDWQSGYRQQVEFRRSQIDRMMAFAETPQCRMTALIRHFGDTADAHRTCGHCDFCAPSGNSAQPFVEPTPSQERDLRTILRALDGQSKATGRLHTDLALTRDRKVFDSLLDGLARAGLISLSAESFTNAEGQNIPYKKASLTYEGQTLAGNAPLGVVLRDESGSNAALVGTKRTCKSAQPAVLDDNLKASKRNAANERGAKRADLLESFAPHQKLLAEKLKDWRKLEAASNGRPAFFVLSDSVLLDVALNCPTTLDGLGRIEGMGSAKVELFGAALCAICRGEAAPTENATDRRTTRTTPKRNKPVVTDDQHPASKFKERTSPVQTFGETTPTFKRERSVGADPTDSLNADQQALELRLREWRKSESERMGLPQFFVLGTTALRCIVLSRPRTLSQLQALGGMDPDKLDKFGAVILQLCNA